MRWLGRCVSVYRHAGLRADTSDRGIHPNQRKMNGYAGCAGAAASRLRSEMDPGFRRDDGGRSKQSGYLLLPVAVAIALIGVIAFLISSESAIEVDMTAGELEAARAQYVAQAGLQHALRHHAQQGCGPYTDLVDYPFGGAEYDTKLSHDLGGTVAYTANVDQDTWIRDDFPTNNYATDTKMHIRNEGGVIERPLLRYDLSAIPAKAAILSARAWFYVNKEHSEGPIAIHVITADWTDTDATWDSMGDQLDSAVTASIPAQTDPGVWVAANLTGQVQAWVNGEDNFGITIGTVGNGVHAEYLSLESVYAPYLEIVVGTPPTSPTKLKSTSKLYGGAEASLERTDVVLRQAPASERLLQPGPADAKDTYLYEWKSTWNYGASNDIWVDERFSDSTAHGLIRFDLGAIPAGARITGALLELYRVNPSLAGGPIGVYAVGASWDEGTQSGGSGESSWDQRDATQTWTNAGGDFGSRQYALETVPVGMGWSAWQIGDLVDAWVSGRLPNEGLALLPEAAGAAAHFASSDATDPTLWPKLSVTYTCACGGICVAPQGSGNLLMVVINPTTLVAEDQKAKDLFESWGYTVSVISESANQSAYDALIALNDVVFISETVNSNQVGIKLVNAPIGVVSQDGDYNPDLGLAPGASLKVGNAIEIVSTDHYITRPFATGLLAIYAADMEQAIVSGSLTADQQVLAETDSDGSLVVLEKGDAMEGGGTAAGRRAILPLGTRYRFDWDYLNPNGRLLVHRALEWGMSKDKVSKGSLLLVVVDPGSLSLQESAKKTLFESWGYNVNLIDESDTQANFDAAVALNNVVYITEDVSSGSVNTKLVDAAIGVVTEEANLSDEFGMAASIVWESGTQVEINDNTHYITSPFPLGLLTIFTANESLAYVTGTQSPDLGRLASSASGYGVVTLEAGAALYGGGSAAGRRAQLPWGGNDFDVNHLNDDGLTILQRALAWGGGATLPPKLPIAHWKLDETTGFTAVDSEGGNDGTLTNGPVWTPGLFQGGLDLDGINDYVDVGGMDVSGSGITMMGWFNAEAIAADDPRIISKASGTNEVDAWWQLSTTDSGADRYLRMRIKAGGITTTFADSSVNLSAGQWYFAVSTYDSASGDMKLYLDGVEVASGSHAVGGALDTDPLVPVAIGANGTVERFFNGVLDDVRIYDYALSAGAIAELAELPGPIAHWKLDDGSGPTAIDSVGSNDATLNGDPSWTTGTLAGALEFDGSGDYATTDNNFTPPPVGTVLFWMKVPGSPGSHGRILGLHDTWEIRHVTTGTADGIPYGLVFDLGVSGVNTEFATTVTVDTPDRWYFVAATYDTNNDAYQVFLDGALHKSGTYPSSLTMPAAAPLSLGTRTGSSNYFTGTLDDVQIYDRILSASEIADFYAAGAPPAPGYTEVQEPWTAATPDNWETVSLASFGVPASAVVEVAVINESTGNQRWGGVREVGSSLERWFQLHEAEDGGVDVVTMHAQADASSQIQHYSDNTADVSFILLGYWTTGSYVELFDSFTANDDGTWINENLGPVGIGPNQVAEIVVSNTDTGAQRLAGVRTPGLGLQRRFNLHEAESGGVDAVSMMVNTDGSSQIQVYAQVVSDIDYYAVGYWSTPPGTYTETGGIFGQATAPSTWQTGDLTTFGVPADSIAQFVLSTEMTGFERELGVRQVGSGDHRAILLQEAEAGGSDNSSMHVNVDASSQIEWYSQDGTSDRYFYPVGWWVLSP